MYGSPFADVWRRYQAGVMKTDEVNDSITASIVEFDFDDEGEDRPKGL